MSRRSFEHLIPVELDFQCENASIMVIDDEPMLTQFVKLVLKKDGFENLCCVNDPHQALDQIKKFQPDLILLDITMPGMSGLDLLEAIRNEPKFRDISVLMLSAAKKQAKYRALNLGAVDFINKPVKPDELKAGVRKALRVI